MFKRIFATVTLALAAVGGCAFNARSQEIDIGANASGWPIGWASATQLFNNGNGGLTVKNNAGAVTTAAITSAGDMTLAGSVTVAADGAYAFTGRSRIVAADDGSFAVTKNDGTSVWSVSNVGAASIGSLTTTGAATVGTNVTLGATGVLQYSGRSKVTAPGDGQLLVQTAAGVTTLSLDSGFNLSTTSISTTGDIAAGAILSGKRATLATGTITSSTPALDISQTWNAGGVTFSAAKINVTDTSSNAASALLDLQVGGASKHKVDKSGNVTIPNDVTIGPSSAATIKFKDYIPAIEFIGAVTLPTASSGFVELVEQSSAPAAPAVNRARVYLLDNGSGKTQLFVRFNTGAAVQIAIEP